MGTGAGSQAEREAEVAAPRITTRIAEGAIVLAFMFGFAIAECTSFFFGGEEEDNEEWS